MHKAVSELLRELYLDSMESQSELYGRPPIQRSQSERSTVSETEYKSRNLSLNFAENQTLVQTQLQEGKDTPHRETPGVEALKFTPGDERLFMSNEKPYGKFTSRLVDISR